MRASHPGTARKIYHAGKRVSRYLHLGSRLGTKSSVRKQTVGAEEATQYNIEWLNKILDGLDKNLIPGRNDPDYFVYVLRLCAQLKALVPGRRVHGHLIQMGVAEHLPLGRYIVQMYLSCGSLAEARSLFNLLPTRDVGLWSSVIAAYAKQGRWQEVIRLLETMEYSVGQPVKVTYFAVMKAFSSPEVLAGARLVHNRILEIGGDSDDVVKAALIEMYGRCGSLEDAKRIFDSVHRRSLLAWNAFIGAFIDCGRIREAIELFWQMQRLGVRPDNITLVMVLNACSEAAHMREGKVVSELVKDYGYESDELVNSSLIHMLGKTGNLEAARRIFDKMEHKDAAVWEKMVAGYSRHGNCTEGFSLLKEMHSKGMVTDAGSCIAFLGACGSLLAVEAGRAAHSWVVKKGLQQDVFVGNALIDMYGQCGGVEDARAVFDSLQEKNWYSWSFMIGAYCYSGYSLQAIQLFLQMLQEGVRPSASTFTSVMTACGHAGFVREGVLFMVYMEWDYDVTPTAEHHGCVINILGRPGWLKETDHLLHKLPGDEPLVWEALLSACRVHGDVERGRAAVEHLLKLSPHMPKFYTVLVGLYQSLGRADEAAKVTEAMKSRGLSEERVTSTVVIGGTSCYEFVTGDKSHHRTERIRIELEELKADMQRAGYVTDPSKLLLHDVAEEQSPDSGVHHSELLAFGLGIIKTPADTPLRIIRNLRMCTGCHTSMKFMSLAVNRTVIVRDGSSVLHRFVEGSCACKDYW